MSDDFQTPEPAGQVSDAVAGNWVDTYAPDWTRPYLRLSRADRPIGTWLLLIPCLWGVLLAAAMTGWRLFDLWIIIGSALGAFLMRGAGCTWNDITDREIDAQVERTRSRPIPAGQVTVDNAYIWMAIQTSVAALILFSFGLAATKLGLLSLVLVAIYPFAKRFTWWPQVFLGLAFNWGALLAWTAHTGSLGLPAVLLYLSGIAWTIFYDTIYAHQDTDDDAMIGVKSTARLFADDTKMWLQRFQMISIVLMAAAMTMGLLSAGVFKLALGLIAALAFGAHMNWQIGRLRVFDSQSCMMLFRSNRDAGLIPALFLAVIILL